MGGFLEQGGGVRLTLAALGALVMAEFRYYAPALVLLLCCMMLDYATGLVKAWMKKSLSSEVGLKGLVKKLCYLFGVAGGFAADLLVSLTAESFGLPAGLPALFGLMATLLLSLNELLSFVENLGEIGVPMPKPLVDALHKLGEQDHFQEE